MTDPVPAPDEVAALLQVEHLLDQRWPETKLEPSTTRIAALLELLGSPQRAYPSIHVAGTNGKTSVCRIIDALLMALHRRTGRTTSPHLQSAVERISIDGKPISPAQYVATYTEIEPFVQLVDQQSEAAGGPKMSKFEVLTAMAFAAFADAPIDVAVVEVGMGGRWDSTNVVDGEVAVLTPIAIDHTRWLGRTVTEIAHEKAGIIKADAVVVSAVQPEAAEREIRERVAEVHATLLTDGEELAVVERTLGVGGQLVTLRTPGGVYQDVFVPLHGEHQAHNALLGLAAVEAFLGGRALDGALVEAAFADVTSPGRLEVVRSSPTVLVDAAHNAAGAEALAEALGEAFDLRHLVGVVAIMADKDAEPLLAALEPVLAEVVVTRNSSERSADPTDLAELAADVFGEDRVHSAERLDEALQLAVDLVERDDPVGVGTGSGVLVTGSVVTVADVRVLLGRG